MKKTILFFAITLLILNQSCDKCDGIDCTTPPSPFTFVLVDKNTVENLFTNGTYDPSQIEFTDKNNDILGFTFRPESGNIIELWGFGVEKTITLKMSGQIIFALHVDAENISEDCCTFTRYEEIELTSDFEFESESETYFTILVE